MRNLRTENYMSNIFALLQTSFDYLVDSNIGENQAYFERLREDFSQLSKLVFVYIKEVDESGPSIAQLPEVPPSGGFGVN